MTPEFAGFKPQAFDFYRELEMDNTRAFWVKNSPIYEEFVKQPMQALLTEMAPGFGQGRIFRPHRDVRFSADKRPYKTHQGAFIPTSNECGYYVQIDADEILIGAGWYAGSSAQIAAYRAAIDSDAGVAFHATVEDLTSVGFNLGGNTLKSRPRGVPADHPRIELLRHKSVTFDARYPSDTSWLHTSSLGPAVASIWREFTPVVAWLGEHVTYLAA